MKKSQIFTIVTFSVAAILLICVLIVGLSTDGLALSSKEKGPRTESQVYEVDPEETPVDSIDISWQDGPITLAESPDGKIHISESSHKKIDEKDQLDLSVKSGLLSLRWDGKWYRRWFTLGLGLQEKALEVQLPKELVGQLEDVEISNTSGEITLQGLATQELEVSTVSGKIELSGCSAAESLSVSSVSGDVSIEQMAAGELKLSTVSGQLDCSGSAGELDAESVSGDMDIALDACPADTELSTVSGRLTLRLPQGSEFTAEYDTLSGEFSTGFGAETLSEHRLRVGVGANRVKMETTSGAMEIAVR